MAVHGSPTATVSEIGLFPLPIVLLPTEQVPLHVFEERYKELIGECLADDREFGFVYADDDGLREVGTRAGVMEVLASFDDGRMNVVVEGRERFKLLGLTSGRSFQTGDIEPVVDDDDSPRGESVDRALELFDRLREITGSEVEAPSPQPAQLSYALAARVELIPEIKQELLQETSERVRLERVCELLDDATVSVERQRRAAERAASNGKVELG
jgi:Lon protease-like protein